MSELTCKQTLREAAKRQRAALHNAKADARILQQLLQTDAFQSSDLVLCYVSVASEVDTRALLSYCFQSKKRVAVPRCERGGVMHFHEIGALSELAASPLSIPEPDLSCPVPTCSEKTLCVVPGLLFDRSGFRIGYGGGYYDRFLARFPGKTIGLCYEALLMEALVREAFDRSVSTVITEQRILTVKSKETA